MMDEERRGLQGRGAEEGGKEGGMEGQCSLRPVFQSLLLHRYQSHLHQRKIWKSRRGGRARGQRQASSTPVTGAMSGSEMGELCNGSLKMGW
jgi:hypothetical protein